MTQYRSIPQTERRLARLIAWAGLALAWVGMILFEPSRRPRRGHVRRDIRRRYPLLSLHGLAAMVAQLILVRAQMLVRPRDRGPVRRRDHSAPGFRRRLVPRQLIRSAIGSRLRAALRHPDLRMRFALILAALNDIDALAANLARRLAHGLTRLRAIIAVRPPHDTCATLAPAAPAHADTS